MLKWVTWMHCKSLWIKASAKCTSTFTRVFLNMSIYTSTWVKDVCTFAISAVLLDIVVGGALALVKRFRMRRRGKRAGALVKLRQRRFRTLLSSIHLATLHSLPNKMDKLLLLSRTNKDFWNCCSVFHGNLAKWRNTGHHVTSAEFPSLLYSKKGCISLCPTSSFRTIWSLFG